ncbi:MAG: ABC transporter ATP-binding protein [Nitrososphaerota archaeon]
MGEIIRASGLTRSFGRLVAVDHIDLEVREGEVFGFLGPNGAGKTTTIKMLTTLLKPSSGSASVCGFDVVREAKSVRASIGLVPQEYTADEDLTGMENVMLMARLYGIPKQDAVRRAQELLELVDLREAAQRKVEHYSGGMRRRLELAMGLINRPRLLFLDEPTLGLDVQTRIAVWNYIRKLKAEYGMTLFMTTHYLEEADALCDRIAIIDRGRVVALGSPAELKKELGGDIVEVSVDGDAVSLEPALARLDFVKAVSRQDSTYRIKVESGEDAAPAIMEAVRRLGYHIRRLQITKPSLNDVYLEYTGRAFREEEPADVWAQRLTLRRARA